MGNRSARCELTDHNIIFQRSKGYLTFDTAKLPINYSLILTHNGGNGDNLIVYRAVTVNVLLLLLLCLGVSIHYIIIIIDHVIIIFHHHRCCRSPIVPPPSRVIPPNDQVWHQFVGKISVK